MSDDKYCRPRLCRLCEKCPIVDGGFTVATNRVKKLSRWWKAHWDTEYDRKHCTICHFCVWDLRFANEISDLKEPRDQKWWPENFEELKRNNMNSETLLTHYQYYKDEMMQPCSVKITLLADSAKQRKVGKVEEEPKDLEQSTQRHQCIYCPRSYFNPHILYSHVKTVHPEEMIRCDNRFCRKYFHTLEEKQEHLEKQHAPKSPKGPVKCFYCATICPNKDNHYHHLRTNHEEQVFRCKYKPCKTYFKTKSERDQHFEEIHNFGKYYCCFCKRYFNDNASTLWNHMKENHKKALKCNAHQRCPNSFKTEEDRQKHVQEKHPSARKFYCLYCPASFSFNDSLWDHIKLKHQGVYIKCQNCVTYFKSEHEKQKHWDKIHKTNSFFCFHCDKLVSLKGGISIHLKERPSSENVIRCSYWKCVTYFKTEEDKAVHTKEAHQNLEESDACVYCNKFINKGTGNMYMHIKYWHSDITIIKCTFNEKCPTYFKTEEDRDKHVREVHQVEKIKEMLQCLFCDKMLTGSIVLKKHVKCYHQDVAIWCQFSRCGQYFKSYQDLDHHLLQNPKHKRGKEILKESKVSHTCPLCSKVLKGKKGHLNSHIKRVHQGQRDKCPHCQSLFSNLPQHLVSDICKICNKKFLCVGLLRMHSLTCKAKHQCPVCAKTFMVNSELQNHCKINHTVRIAQWRGLEFKSRGFKCNECFAYYKTKDYLLTHLKSNIHRAVPLFVTCDVCKKEFSIKNILYRHILKVHLKSKN